MQVRKQVWILEDEECLQEIYRDFLKDEYDVQSFVTLQEFTDAITSAKLPKPDAMLCDIRLSDGTIFDVTQTEHWRNFTRETKVFMVTASDDVETVKRCFKEGAIDCMSKPFRKTELRAKLQHYLAENESGVQGKFNGASTRSAPAHGIRIDLHDLRVYRNNQRSEPFTSKEVQIMSQLLDSPELIASRAAMVENVWHTTKVTTKTLDVHLFNLRRKLAPLGINIRFIEPSSYALQLN